MGCVFNRPLGPMSDEEMQEERERCNEQVHWFMQKRRIYDRELQKLDLEMVTKTRIYFQKGIDELLATLPPEERAKATNSTVTMQQAGIYLRNLWERFSHSKSKKLPSLLHDLRPLCKKKIMYQNLTQHTDRHIDMISEIMLQFEHDNMSAMTIDSLARIVDSIAVKCAARSESTSRVSQVLDDRMGQLQWNRDRLLDTVHETRHIVDGYKTTHSADISTDVAYGQDDMSATDSDRSWMGEALQGIGFGAFDGWLPAAPHANVMPLDHAPMVSEAAALIQAMGIFGPAFIPSTVPVATASRFDGNRQGPDKDDHSGGGDNEGGSVNMVDIVLEGAPEVPAHPPVMVAVEVAADDDVPLLPKQAE